jgi:cyclophilin family peptidyl-prolyl cis-trans isomerase
MVKLPIAFIAVLFLTQAVGQPPPPPLTARDRAILKQQAETLGEPLPVLNAEKIWSSSALLWPLLQMEDVSVTVYTLRALGRLEDPANVRPLLALAQRPGIFRSFGGRVIAQSLNGFDPNQDPDLIEDAAAFLRRVIFLENLPKDREISPEPAGMVRYRTPEQVHAVESEVLRLLERTQTLKTQAPDYLSAARALESLARLNSRVTSFNPETARRLSRMAINTWPNDGVAVRRAAFAALVSTQGLDAETERRALRDDDEGVRRLATVVLGASGGGLEEDERFDAIQDRLSDGNAQVRYEALRAYLRRSVRTRGCQPVYDLLDDRDTHVALAAIDAFGTICLDDKEITKRFQAQATVPPPNGPWHRGVHAFVTLARRDREAASELFEPFVAHQNFWVRMYAVRAAVALDRMETLNKLAYDKHPNVREAALDEMARLKRPETYDAAIAALGDNDIQLVRTAALILKQFAGGPKAKETVLAALLRLTKEGKETSRDARLPLLETFALSATADAAESIGPLLKDIDPLVAAAAGDLIAKLTGKPAKVEPTPVARGWPIQYPDLRNQCVAVAMSTGRSFVMRMSRAAPLAADRFLKLALVDRYYDGLSFHRVVPNFVIQGGSPGANEYSGHQFFMRDEIGARHSRGTVGLSTRGRNTADAQIFINLVDNFRLDSGYTVFASVHGPDLPVIDAIEEGDVMQKFSSIECPKTGG